MNCKAVYILIEHDFCNLDFYILGVYSTYKKAKEAYNLYEEGLSGTPIEENSNKYSIVEVELDNLVSWQRNMKSITDSCVDKYNGEINNY